MRGSLAKDVGPLQHTSHARAAFESARNEQNHFAWCVNLHRLKTNSRALVQLPAHWNGARPRRGEIWRPEAPGRNDCLSDRRERVSFRQRRAAKSQGGMTGRPFGPLLTFRLVGTRGKVSDHGIVFQRRKWSCISITYGQDVWPRTLCRKKLLHPDIVLHLHEKKEMHRDASPRSATQKEKRGSPQSPRFVF